jgi:hypothetical protein
VEIHWTNLDGLDERDRQDAEETFRRLAESHNDLIDLRITGKRNGREPRASEEVRSRARPGVEIVAAEAPSGGKASRCHRSLRRGGVGPGAPPPAPRPRSHPVRDGIAASGDPRLTVAPDRKRYTRVAASTIA